MIVGLYLDGGKNPVDKVMIPSVKAGATRTVPLYARFAKVGYHSVRASFDQPERFDSLEADNQNLLVVRAVRVEHSPIRNAFGFVFEADGRKLAFSGDTAYCPALIDAGRGADVLVHECFIHREMEIIPGVRTKEGTDAVASYHTLSSEVGKVARAAGAKCLVLNHFVPTRFDRAALLAEVRCDYNGPIVIGEDLLGIDISRAALIYQNMTIGLDALA